MKSNAVSEKAAFVELYIYCTSNRQGFFYSLQDPQDQLTLKIKLYLLMNELYKNLDFILI